jgi:hypothetical protein
MEGWNSPTYVQPQYEAESSDGTDPLYLITGPLSGVNRRIACLLMSVSLDIMKT